MSEPDVLHESSGALSTAVVNQHRAIRSLMEELEAVDWYAQRIEASDDPALRDVLTHNRDEEKEHAAMVLEWLRRHDPVLDGFLRRYLFTSAPIGEIEEQEEAAEAAAEPRTQPAGLGIGSLRGELG